MFPYNLACYCAQLRPLDDCQEWFNKALAIDEQTVKRAATDDPEMKPIRDSLGGMLLKQAE
jgi:hypothetical protein